MHSIVRFAAPVAALALALLVPAALPEASAAPAGSSAVPAPGTAGLRPDLALAYTVAWRDARAAGISLSITSGKRSRAEQAVLWREGIATHGSPEAARRWVLPPGESTHVTGEAIDVGPRAGAAWLERSGARYGLCRPFANEWWHFERLAAPGGKCPPRVRDASVRPRR